LGQTTGAQVVFQSKKKKKKKKKKERVYFNGVLPRRIVRSEVIY
jgi:hypothetical protein